MKLIIFDVDGTLVTTKSGATFRKTADDWQWLPGRLEKLRELKLQGIRLAIATNQGGVAFGFMKQDDILAELIHMCDEGGIPRGGLYICYTHPKAKIADYQCEDYRRKPGPGMLIEAVQDFDATYASTLYVGDRPEDEEAASQAGVDFQWANNFFTS